MADILIRDLDPKAVARLKARARARGRSLQAEAKEILEEAVRRDPAAARREMERISRSLQGRSLPDPAELVREDRDR